MWGKEEERGGMPEQKAQKERGNITREEIKSEVMIKKDMKKKRSGRTQYHYFYQIIPFL